MIPCDLGFPWWQLKEDRWIDHSKVYRGRIFRWPHFSLFLSFPLEFQRRKADWREERDKRTSNLFMDLILGWQMTSQLEFEHCCCWAGKKQMAPNPRYEVTTRVVKWGFFFMSRSDLRFPWIQRGGLVCPTKIIFLGPLLWCLYFLSCIYLPIMSSAISFFSYSISWVANRFPRKRHRGKSGATLTHSLHRLRRIKKNGVFQHQEIFIMSRGSISWKKMAPTARHRVQYIIFYWPPVWRLPLFFFLRMNEWLFPSLWLWGFLRIFRSN